MADKRIGIIGGVGPSATTLYYQLILEGSKKRGGGIHFPEMVIHSLDLGRVNDYFYRNDMQSLRDMLVDAVEGLHGAGCDFAILSCNAMHMVFEDVQERAPVPMLSIVEFVLKEVMSRQLQKVGIMGTTFVMHSGLYRNPLERLGVACLEPDAGGQEWIMKVILDDLQRPVIPEETIRRLVGVVGNLGEKGAQGVILACTDLPAAIKQKDTAVLLLDTTKIHVNAVLDYALGSGKQPFPIKTI